MNPTLALILQAFVMNPTLVLILQKNSADIEAIVSKIGVGTLLSLVPQFLRIAATLQAPVQPAVQGQPQLRA